MTIGSWAAAEYKIGDFLLNPSIRLDHYRYSTDIGTRARIDEETSVNPRLSVAFQATDKLAIKAAGGRFTGPPRFSFSEPPIVFGPIPGYQGAGLNLGLVTTDQYQTGVEIKLPHDLELALTTYYHDSFSPVDFSLFDVVLEADTSPCNGDSGEAVTPLDVDDAAMAPNFCSGGNSVSRSSAGFPMVCHGQNVDSQPEGATTRFRSTSIRLTCSTELSRGRLVAIGPSAVSFTSTPGDRPSRSRLTAAMLGFFEGREGAYNADRLPNYWRIDLRVQKREVFETWFFDFYIDFFNAAFQFETIDRDVDFNGDIINVTVPLFIPMIGIRGEF